MGKRVLLIHPLRPGYVFNDTPHVGSAILAAILKQAGHEVRVIDYVLYGRNHPSVPQVVNAAKSFAPDVIGLSLYTSAVTRTFEIIDALRPLGVPIMVGGPHTAVYTDKLRLEKRLDYVCKGEAESTILSVVEEATLQPYPLVVESLHFDLDSVPDPDFTTFDHWDSLRTYPLLTSRGCPYRCSFCVVHQLLENHWRHRSIGRCLDEVQGAVRLFPNIRAIAVSDDNPMANPGRFKDLLSRLGDLHLSTLLSIANVRADCIDQEFLTLAKRANCEAICFGAESADPEVFALVNKKESLEEISAAARLVKQNNMSLGLCFVIGLPKDTFEGTKRSVAFAKQLQPDYVYWNTIHPFPGTPARRWFDEHGCAVADDTDYSSHFDMTWDCGEPLVETTDFTRRDRRKARFYAVIETDQYVPQPQLLPDLVTRAKEYGLVPEAISSLVRMRSRFPNVASIIDNAITGLSSRSVSRVSGGENNLDAGAMTGGNERLYSRLGKSLFGESSANDGFLDAFLTLYPRIPFLAFWRAIEAKMIAQIPMEAPILDLGCGDGSFTAIVRQGKRVDCGLDVSEVNFAAARRTDIYDKLQTYDGKHFPFPDGSFATILSNCVLEHVEDLGQVLSECARVLRPGGRLIFTVPSEHYDDMLFFRQYYEKLGLPQKAIDHVEYHRRTSQHLNVLATSQWQKLFEDVGLQASLHKSFMFQCSQWIFDILKVLRDTHVEVMVPRGETLDSPEKILNAALLDVLLHQLYEMEGTGQENGSGALYVALRPAKVPVPATPEGATPAQKTIDLRAALPSVDRRIYDNPAPFFKHQSDEAGYACKHAELSSEGLEQVRCYRCGEDDPEPLGTKERLHVVRCRKCGFWYVNPRLPQHKLVELYDRSYWFDRMAMHGYPDLVTRAGHDYRLASGRIQLIRRFKQSGRLLDIGCSNGALVKRASEMGFQAMGLELDHDIAEIARQASECEIREGHLSAQSFLPETFDVITLLDVLEHFYDPVTELKEIRRVLKKDGLLFVETFRRDCPTFIGPGADILAHDDIKPAEHIYMHSESDLAWLLARAGLRSIARGYPEGEQNSRILLFVSPVPIEARSGVGEPGAPAVSVIIPSYNRKDALAKCLKALVSQSSPAQEIIVVDDGSTDGTADVVAPFVAVLPLKYVRQAHSGPARARNLGIREATGDLVVLLGDDTIPDPRFIEEHLAGHRSEPGAGVAIVGYIPWSSEHSVSYFMEYIVGEGGQQFAYKALEKLDKKNLPYGWFLTSNISLKRRFLLENDGYFSEDFRHAAYEDVELGYRLHRRGLRLVFREEAVAYHLHPTTFESFCDRQRKAGRMAVVFARKHPEVELLGPAVRRWPELLKQQPAILAEIDELSKVDLALLDGDEPDGHQAGLQLRARLGKLYGMALQTCLCQGIVEELQEQGLEGLLDGVAATGVTRVDLGAASSEDRRGKFGSDRARFLAKWADELLAGRPANAGFPREEAAAGFVEAEGTATGRAHTSENRLPQPKPGNLGTPKPVAPAQPGTRSSTVRSLEDVCRELSRQQESFGWLHDHGRTSQETGRIIMNSAPTHRPGSTNRSTYYDLPRPEVQALVPLSAGRILDVGCGAGALGKALKERQSCEVTGIECVPEMAEIARSRLDRVYVGDVAQIAPLFPDSFFDCIVMADVLEHLADPRAVLEGLLRTLAPNGRLVLSVPNVRHWSVLLGLLEGRWDYSEAGLLDRTHLRFFTRGTIEELLISVGLRIASVDTASLEVDPIPERLALALRDAGVNTSTLQNESQVYQYLYVAEPLPQSVTIPITSIIILACNQLENTRRCLDSVEACTPEPHEIIVVDNGSTDGTVEYLRDFMSSRDYVRVIANDSNLGFAAGANQGLAIARGDYLLLLNNDTVVTDGWLGRMQCVFTHYPRVGLVGPMSNYVSGPQLIRGVTCENVEEIRSFAASWAQQHHTWTMPYPRLVGFCLLIKKAVVDRVGGLDERFGAGNFEDDDLCVRAAIAGFEARIAQDVFIYHMGGQTFAGASIDFKQSMLRNWELFKAKWEIPPNTPIEQGYRIQVGSRDVSSYFIPLPAVGPSSFLEARVQAALR